MKRRGGYSGNLTCQVRIRVPLETYNQLMEISGMKETTLSRILRELLSAGLKDYSHGKS